MSTTQSNTNLQSQEKDRKVGRKGYGLDRLDLPSDVRERVESFLDGGSGGTLSGGADSAMARAMGAIVEHMLGVEFDHQIGHSRHERIEPSAEQSQSRRENPRNGYSEKTLKTSVGQARIKVPRDRTGSFEPVVLPKNRSYTQEFSDRIIAMYASGVTQRDLVRQIHDLYGVDLSDDFVSDVMARIEPELKAWRNRPLEPVYAIVYVDALHQKIRHSNGVRATACYIVSGYCESGCHEVLGVWIAPSEHSDGHGESASFWQMVLNELRSRGVDDVLFIASDDLSGLDTAIATTFSRAEHIPCVVHQVRNSLKQVGAKARKEVAAALKPIYTAATIEAAELALEQLDERYAGRYPAIVQQWRQLLPRLGVLWTFSKELRKMIYTTNPQENINRQVRKVTKNRGAMPTIDSALRLLTLVLRAIDQRAQERARPDWPAILRELHLHFGARLPNHWGCRLA